MDIGSSPVQEEVLIPQLAGYQLKDVSSMVEASEMATIHAAPGVFNPQTSRLVKIHAADSARWANLGELKLCYEIVNLDQEHPLELLVPALGVFSQYRLMSQGTTITQLDRLERLLVTLNSTLNLDARVFNGEESIGMKHGIHFKDAPNADGRYLLHGEDGIASQGMFDGSQETSPVPKMSDLEVERYLVIPPGGKKTVSVTPLCGACNSMLLCPLPSCSGEDRRPEKGMSPSWVC